MIPNFEKRYEKLLKDVDDDSLVMLLPVESRSGHIYQTQQIRRDNKNARLTKGPFVETYC